jgi:hypothetical protein
MEIRMPNSPVRKDAPRAQEPEAQPETIIVDHTVRSITDAYISADRDLLIVRRLHPGSDQALGVNEISFTPDAARRLRELMDRFLSSSHEENAVRRPIVSQRDQPGAVPDVIARFLREEEEEEMARLKDKYQNEPDAEPNRSTVGEATGNEFFPERPPYVLRKGLMPTRAPKEK